MKMTVAKALKLKNRLASKLENVSEYITKYNSVLVGQQRLINIKGFMKNRGAIINALIDVKTLINIANAPIQSKIYLLAELKGTIVFYKGIDTAHGKKVKSSPWDDAATVCDTTAIYNMVNIQQMIEDVEKQIDDVQDVLDKHNHTMEIDVDDYYIKLLTTDLGLTSKNDCQDN